MQKTSKKIKIGLDFHGVLATNPQYFSAFCHKVIDRGWELHIITGGPRKDVLKYLKDNAIAYSKIYTILDECDKLGLVEYFADGSFYVNEAIWNKAKAEYCRKNSISFHIDDSAEYSPYFSTPFCLYKCNKNKCIMADDGFSIRFTDGVDKALENIEEYLQKKEL